MPVEQMRTPWGYENKVSRDFCGLSGGSYFVDVDAREAVCDACAAKLLIRLAKSEARAGHGRKADD